MPQSIEALLSGIERILDGDLGPDALSRAIALMGGGAMPLPLIAEMRLYGDYLPKADELVTSPRQRALHFLWESLDKLPASAVANFAIPLRRMIAERLFKRCGRNFIADENVRFNFGQNIELGDDVFMNRGGFIDSKGGVSIGDGAGLAEFIVIFTHSHSESNHAERTYAPVRIGARAKIYTSAMILPGVTIGDEAIVAAKSLVSSDVEPGAVVAGAPAKPVRARRREGKVGAELNHIWLRDGAFQGRS